MLGTLCRLSYVLYIGPVYSKHYFVHFIDITEETESEKLNNLSMDKHLAILDLVFGFKSA